MAEGRYVELVKLYRKAHTTYSSSILSQVLFSCVHDLGLVRLSCETQPMEKRQVTSLGIRNEDMLCCCFQVRVEAEAVGQQACTRLMEVLRSADVSLQEQIDAVGYLQDLQYDGDEPLQACFDGQK